jgi:hypothetical protein
VLRSEVRIGARMAALVDWRGGLVVADQRYEPPADQDSGARCSHIALARPGESCKRLELDGHEGALLTPTSSSRRRARRRQRRRPGAPTQTPTGPHARRRWVEGARGKVLSDLVRCGGAARHRRGRVAAAGNCSCHSRLELQVEREASCGRKARNWLRVFWYMASAMVVGWPMSSGVRPSKKVR